MPNNELFLGKILSLFFSLENLKELDVLDSDLLEKGKKIVKEHKIIMCGISRDNAPEFFTMKRHLEYIGDQFKDYKIIIFENDSKDGTKDLLLKWEKDNPKVKVIMHDFHNQKRPNIKFLADARNYYIREANKPEYDSFDILAVVDMDMSHGFDIRGIYHSFSFFEEWDAVCANGIYKKAGNMYDAFAFRNKEFPWIPNETADYWSKKVHKIQKIYHINSDLVEVDSAFGSLAFYKKEKLNRCVYDSINDDCEHVKFHECLKNNGGHMVMNPSMIVKYSHYRYFL
ncbi:MAG: hypothetical protein HEEMFOPI_01049 [Holosporales bacterium]